MGPFKERVVRTCEDTIEQVGASATWSRPQKPDGLGWLGRGPWRCACGRSRIRSIYGKSRKNEADIEAI